MLADVPGAGGRRKASLLFPGKSLRLTRWARVRGAPLPSPTWELCWWGQNARPAAPTVRAPSHLTIYTLRGDTGAASTESVHRDLGLGLLSVTTLHSGGPRGARPSIKPVTHSEPLSHVEEKCLTLHEGQRLPGGSGAPSGAPCPLARMVPAGPTSRPDALSSLPGGIARDDVLGLDVSRAPRTPGKGRSHRPVPRRPSGAGRRDRHSPGRLVSRDLTDGEGTAGQRTYRDVR